jgi:hypothetical protein
VLAGVLNDFAYDSHGRSYQDYQGLSGDEFGVFRMNENKIGGWT